MRMSSIVREISQGCPFLQEGLLLTEQLKGVGLMSAHPARSSLQSFAMTGEVYDTACVLLGGLIETRHHGLNPDFAVGIVARLRKE
jgi:hypothetical protein